MTKEYDVIVYKNVKKFLSHHNDVISRFYEKVSLLRKDPSLYTDCKKMKWYKNTYRMRVWKYRFIYKVDKEKVIILFIDAWSRGQIYSSL